LLSRDVVDKIAMRAPFSGVLLIFEHNHILPEIELFFMLTYQMKAKNLKNEVTMRLSAAIIV